MRKIICALLLCDEKYGHFARLQEKEHLSVHVFNPERLIGGTGFSQSNTYYLHVALGMQVPVGCYHSTFFTRTLVFPKMTKSDP